MEITYKDGYSRVVYKINMGDTYIKIDRGTPISLMRTVDSWSWNKNTDEIDDARLRFMEWVYNEVTSTTFGGLSGISEFVGWCSEIEDTFWSLYSKADEESMAMEDLK